MTRTPPMARTPLLVALLAWLAMAPAATAADEVVDVASRGKTFRILVNSPAADPVAAVVLFAGGNGLLMLSEDGSIDNLAGNFLIRSRGYFDGHGMVTAAIDAPPDQSHGLYRFRGTEDHARDVAAVIAYLRARFGVPVWLVGTSRGTNSVANAAIRLKGAEGPDGIVLTASMLTYNKRGDYVLGMDLDEITVPVVIAHHKRDRCRVTPPDKVDALAAALANAKRVEVLWYDGGEARGNVCQARHYHGFNGIELDVVGDIAAAIKRTLSGGG